MEKLAVVLIVKNEEAVLGRCIASLRGVDQIVVLDTGSTDRTRDVAASAGAEVYETPPIVPFHFGEARNRALAHAKHDWCISIDADEIAGKGTVKILKRSLAYNQEARCHGMMVRFVMRSEVSDKTYPILKLKVFRKSAFEWKYRVHEMLVPKINHPKVFDLPEASFEHLPPPDKAGRHRQNHELLELAIKENPEYTRNIRQLALELMLAKRHDEAIAHLKDWLGKMPVFDPLERCEALMYIAKCHLGASGLNSMDPRYEIEMAKDPSRTDELVAQFLAGVDQVRVAEAVRSFAQGATEAPSRREPFFFAGETLFRMARIEEAVPWLEKAVAIKKRPEYHLNEDYVWGGGAENLLRRARQLLSVARAK